MRCCNQCNQTLELEVWFRKNRTKPLGRDRTCRVCSLKYDLKKRAKRKGFIETYGPEDCWRTLRAYNMCCFNCSNTQLLTIDHHQPHMPLSPSNAVVLCESCNQSKGDKDPALFYSPEKLNDISTRLGLV